MRTLGTIAAETQADQCACQRAVLYERQRIVNLLMIQHEAAKGSHNYWLVAAKLIQADEVREKAK